MSCKVHGVFLKKNSDVTHLRDQACVTELVGLRGFYKRGLIGTPSRQKYRLYAERPHAKASPRQAAYHAALLYRQAFERHGEQTD